MVPGMPNMQIPGVATAGMGPGLFRCHWFISISAHSWVNGGILREFSLLSRRLQRQRAATTRSRAHVWNATITSRLVLCRKVGMVGNTEQLQITIKFSIM
jgi:hypothetical protein